MNRYEIIFENGKTLLLYKKQQSDINTSLYERDLGKIKSINLYKDTSHEKYIELIKQQSEFIGIYNSREVYRSEYYKGYLIIQLAKDPEDNHYYDYADYLEYVNNRILQPITRTMSTPKQVYELIKAKTPEYCVVSHRYYREPKLSKPKELKGIKPIGKVTYIPKHCEPQIFIKEADVYIKHTDYFSSMWRPPKGERVDMSLSYYAEKYFNKNKKEKFIYPDCWGSIILRSEAWIKLKDIIPLIETENNIIVAKEIIKLQRTDKYSPRDIETDLEWLRFWENVSKVVRSYLEEREEE